MDHQINYLDSSELNEFNDLYSYFGNELKCDVFFNEKFRKYVVIKNNNRIVGFLIYTLLVDQSELEYIYVIDEFRGNNLSSNLLNFYIDECKRAGVKSVTLEVATNNNIAINLYKKFGFGVASTRSKYYNGTDAFLMYRNLGDIDE